MKEYELIITQQAKDDMISAADYIDYSLRNPQAADTLLDEAEICLGGLRQFPARNPLIDDPVLRSWGIRFQPVKNYLAFYQIDEDARLVRILRFLHGRRDWLAILKVIPRDD